MEDMTQIKTADLNRIRQAVNTLRDVLSLYPTKIEPLSTAERDRHYNSGVCLWCGKALGTGKKPRGCHEYCVTLAKTQADDSTLVQLNRLMPATKGGRPSKRITDALDAIETKSSGKKNH